jgi:NAD(P)-dependent dehydrogenase (short-subunit alcohol dehydrogenase family)
MASHGRRRRKGARPTIVQPLADHAEEASRSLPDAEGLEADIRDRAAVERMMAEVVDRFGIDILSKQRQFDRRARRCRVHHRFDRSRE